MREPQKPTSGTPSNSSGAPDTPTPKQSRPPAAFEEFVVRPNPNTAAARVSETLPTFQEFSRGSQRQQMTRSTPPAPLQPNPAVNPPPPQIAQSAAVASTRPVRSGQPANPESPLPSSASTAAAASPSPAPSVKTDYSEQTQRIHAWGALLKSIQPLIWAAVLLVVVIPLFGKALLSHVMAPIQAQRTLAPLTQVVVQPIPRRAKVDQAMVEAVQSARASAQAFATAELAEWEAELEPRVDDFLDWYFDYFNQKKMEFTTPFVWLSSATAHFMDSKRMTAGEAVSSRFTEDFQREFAKRVLVPRNAQMRLELLTADTVNRYVSELSHNIDKVKTKYRIPQGQWDRYLTDMSTTVQDTEGNISNLSLKMLVGGSSYLVTKPLILATAGKIGSKLSTKLAGSATAKLAAKTGGAVATELGTSLIDPIVGVGIFIWDVWDYQHTVDVERPILRANLLDYLEDVQQALLTNPETGVLSAIYQLEEGIFKHL